MRTRYIPFLLAVSTIIACEDKLVRLGTIEPYLIPDPAILILEPGKSGPVTVAAFNDDEPADVTWAIGAIQGGLTIVEDTSYSRVYVGNRLMQLGRTQERRFVVTLNDTLPGTFVVSGDASAVTISVRPAVPTP